MSGVLGRSQEQAHNERRREPDETDHGYHQHLPETHDDRDKALGTTHVFLYGVRDVPGEMPAVMAAKKPTSNSLTKACSCRRFTKKRISATLAPTDQSDRKRARRSPL